MGLSSLQQMNESGVAGDVSEVKARRTAHSERSGLIVHEHREHGTTQHSRCATSRTL